MHMFCSLKLFTALLGSSCPLRGPIWSQNGLQNGPKSGPKSNKKVIKKMTPKITENVQIVDPRMDPEMLPKLTLFGPLLGPFWGPFWDQIGPRRLKTSPREPSRGSQSQNSANLKTLENHWFFNVFGV